MVFGEVKGREGKGKEEGRTEGRKEGRKEELHLC
jgi:predicted transposase YdaD